MKSNQKVMRFLYIGFVSLGVFSSVRGDFSQAGIYMGIALAFDPFDPEQSWKERPMWQKSVLILNLALCAAFFGFQVGLGDK